MKSFYLVETTTKDGLIHHGAYFEPVKKGKRAILWVHGLTSTFYNGGKLTDELVRMCDEASMGFAAFNNRGHDFISGGKRVDASAEHGYVRVVHGSGYEVFEESVHDIDAGITFLVEKGYTDIILIGHSTGAEKVCYYAGTINDPRVVGVVLAGAVSDRFGPGVNKEEVEKNLTYMQQRIKEGKGDELVNGYAYFPLTPKRYISIYGPGGPGDVFDYGEKEPKLTVFKNITISMLVINGENDEYAGRPISEIMKVYDTHQKSSRYNSVIVPGGNHGFDGVETRAAQAMIEWIKSI